jgi:hypothetical protein
MASVGTAVVLVLVLVLVLPRACWPLLVLVLVTSTLVAAAAVQGTNQLHHRTEVVAGTIEGIGNTGTSRRHKTFPDRTQDQSTIPDRGDGGACVSGTNNWYYDDARPSLTVHKTNPDLRVRVRVRVKVRVRVRRHKAPTPTPLPKSTSVHVFVDAYTVSPTNNTV